MSLSITVKVKFRALGIDFGKFEKTLAFSVPVGSEPFAGLLRDGLYINERGVTVNARIVGPEA